MVGGNARPGAGYVLFMFSSSNESIQTCCNLKNQAGVDEVEVAMCHTERH